mmetsp:Transcript_10252/g.23776  ORF Transcript_10252/g.23776 Transcript_10252/m.23776 type:complete len:734 (+) Transcript_10252:20-2221(+)
MLRVVFGVAAFSGAVGKHASRLGRSHVTMAASAPYGSWESPITAAFITEAGVGLGGLTVGPVSSDLFWLERRSKEGGRSVLCRRAPGDAAASERGGVDVTPAGSNVRTRVHEYGGNSLIIGQEAGAEYVIYSNFADQRLYKLPVGGGESLELTPKSAYAEDARYRFADFALDEPRKRLICVREDHSNPNPADVVNAVVAVALDGSGAMEVLAAGSDFYAAPRLSPDGSKLAFVSWEHPNMPWDSTRLSVVELEQASGRPKEGTAPTVVAGADGRTSVLQPAWSPKTGELFFVSDGQNGFWNLHCVPDAQSTPLGRWERATNVMPLGADFSGSAPGWALGQQGYSFARSSGAVLAAVRLPGEAASTLLVLDSAFPHAELSRHSAADGGLPYGFGGLCSKEDGTVYLLGSSPQLPAAIYEWSGLTTAAAAPATMLASSMKADAVIDPKFISSPQLMQFPTTDEAKTGVLTAYGYYYPPTNGDFSAPEGELPPLLVKAHGGPTACTGASFNPGTLFWTSRGFAVMDVDYRGSTGYGRSYRQALAGNWGIVDIEDVCAAAQFLSQQGLADPARLCIDGGSAGGFTTLGALAFKKVFAAGCSLYGVADCSALAADTHKFESRYLDGLIGKYPEEKAKYDARSAIYSTETLSCPVLLLQGDEDKIVPPNQAEAMHKALLDKGIPTALKMYKGEQHGFRQAANIQDALNSELFFFSRVLQPRFEPPGVPAFAIDNFDNGA